MSLIDELLPVFALPRCGTIRPLDEHDRNHRDPDPRGLVKLYEPPKKNAKYVMGIDVAGGIIGWDRARRTSTDLETDNSAIEIIRVGNGRDIPDLQVAEYAAPIQAEDVVEIAVLLGRLYCGNSEYGEALCIIETNPGPGLLTHQNMVQDHSYVNMWRWEQLGSIAPTIANSYGWSSNKSTLHYLWSRFSRHVGKKLLRIKSPHLQQEMNNLQVDPIKTFPQPSGQGGHDDRVRAMATAIWAAHGWALGEERPEPEKITGSDKPRNWQASDCTFDQMQDEWEEAYQRMLNE